MGNREDLLAGAKRCLYARGYAATTARDIASEAGVSLAAIGYHYGTKDVLLRAALMEALEEWGTELSRLLAAQPAGAAPNERFAAAWEGVRRSYVANRPLWSIQFEVLSQLDRDVEMRRAFADANRDARLALAQLFGPFGETDEDRLLALGSFYQVLLGGAAAQNLVDPDTALSADDLMAAVRLVASGLGPTKSSPQRGRPTGGRRASPTT